jgi:hypothetical protein
MNTQYIIFLVVIYFSIFILFILGLVAASYIYTRSKYGQKIARKATFQGVSIFVAIIVLLFVLTLTVIFLPVTPDFPFEQIDIIALGFEAIISATILLAIIVLINRWHQSRIQKRLLVLPYGAYQAVYILLGAMLLLITTVRFANNTSMDLERISMGTYQALLGLFMVLMGFIKQTMTQEGFFVGVRFVEWESIKSYTWEGEKSFLLKIQTNRSFLFGNITVEVRKEAKAAVETILQEYVQQR